MNSPPNWSNFLNNIQQIKRWTELTDNLVTNQEIKRLGEFVAGESSKDFVEALARGLEVIRAFGPATPQMTSAQVAAKTGLARPTAHRLLLTLESLGYARNSDAGFSLTPRVVDLGMSYIATRGLWDIARPHMEDVVAATNQSCSITELDGSDIIYLARVIVPKVLSMALHVGTRSPARSTSMGDVLLADLAPHELASALSRPSRSDFLARETRTDAELETVLPQVRKQGWAISDERLAHGVRAVSVPLTNAHARTVAAISIAVHSTEVSVDQIKKEILPLLVATAANISTDWCKYDELPMASLPIAGK